MKQLVRVLLMVALLGGVGIALLGGDTGGGRRWCESVIEDYRQGQRLAYDMEQGPIKILRREPDRSIGNTSSFWLEPDGQFTCQAIGSTAMFPTAEVYDSRSDRWTTID